MLEKLNIGIWGTINIVSLSIDFIIFFLAIDLVEKKKVSNIKSLFGMILILIIIVFVNIYNINPNTKITICIIVGTLLYILLYKDKIYKCILVSLLFWLGLMLSEGIAVSIVMIINNLNNINIILNGNLFRMESIIISKVFLFIILILFK